MKIIFRKLKRIISIASTVLILLLVFVCWQIYFPVKTGSVESIEFTAQKGEGDDEIAVRLEDLGIIKNNYFFRFYVIVSGSHGKLQAGKYSLSPNMTIAEMVRKFSIGDVIKQKITILEGWDILDIEKYLVEKEICIKEEFQEALAKDYSGEFSFLKEKPSGVGLEGYLFPDTYNISLGESAEDIVRIMLSNFDKKLNTGLREQALSQGKTVYEIVTMASIIEKEVRTMDDKKIVSGIFWKRIDVGMALQSCATVNYITGKNDPGVSIKDTQIDSLYNTYKYRGLPLGPISNPGLDSILAAIYPDETSYWYYLAGPGGKTIFSKTYKEHIAASNKYLK